MSKELSPEDRLRALVIADPSPSDGYLDCGLRRAARQLGVHQLNEDDDLFAVGQRLGFSKAEALGITRGWDRAAGAQHMVDPVANGVSDLRGVARGEEIGRRVHAAFRAHRDI